MLDKLKAAQLNQLTDDDIRQRGEFSAGYGTTGVKALM